MSFGDVLNEVLSSPSFWTFVLPMTGAIVAWFTNEWRKRLADQYQRKEASYQEMLRTLRGFYVGAENSADLKAQFLSQLNISWLYCPDHVIRKGYAFLMTVHTSKVHADEVKEAALGEFVAAIRQDLLSRKLVRKTSLTAADFKHLR